MYYVLPTRTTDNLRNIFFCFREEKEDKEKNEIG